MQTSHIEGNEATPLVQRMQAVLSWCLARGIKQVYSFFHGCDIGLKKHEVRIRYVLRNSPHIVSDADEIWIASMEATIKALAKRQAA